MRTIIFTAILLASTPVFATGEPFVLSGNAIAQCKGALPVYESGLRSRPRAVANEGAIPTFVNCGLLHQSNSYGYDWVKFRLGNIGSGPVTTTCTVISGREGETNAVFYTIPNVTNIAVGSVREVTVTAANLGGGNHVNRNVTIQCRLSPGGTLTDVSAQFRH